MPEEKKISLYREARKRKGELRKYLSGKLLKTYESGFLKDKKLLSRLMRKSKVNQ